ncbi:MAG: hypothetical protein CBD88_00475 [Flavobacteriales bacterium TMED228]|jgi:hypothetical protein|nr:MAG: hypothetical protein CBD88_00475 [Flavobacteriales bacterium TMED228]|tara:strand:+ start:6397 stop:7038 length:642 start_codon:yes stop_codon:yes gene_type:complete
MALGLTTSDGSSTNKIYDRLGYNAKDGVYTHSYYDRENEIRENEEYKKDFKVLVDFEAMEVGWADFNESPPSIVTVPLGTNQPPNKPTETHKEYFVVKIYNKNLGVVTFGSSAGSIINAVDKLHDSYLEANEKEKIPVVHFDGLEGPIKWGKAKVFIPNMKIVDWKERPEELKIAESNTESKQVIDFESKSEEVKSPMPNEIDALTEEFDEDF